MQYEEAMYIAARCVTFTFPAPWFPGTKLGIILALSSSHHSHPAGRHNIDSFRIALSLRHLHAVHMQPLLAANIATWPYLTYGVLSGPFKGWDCGDYSGCCGSLPCQLSSFSTLKHYTFFFQSSYFSCVSCSHSTNESDLEISWH